MREGEEGDREGGREGGKERESTKKENKEENEMLLQEKNKNATKGKDKL